MDITFTIDGRFTLFPPVPVAALWEVLDARLPAFVLAPVGASAEQVDALAARRGWVLVAPGDDAPDTQGLPQHIDALVVKADAPRRVIDDALALFFRACRPTAQFLGGALVYEGDHHGGQGIIRPAQDSTWHEPQWVQTRTGA